MSDETWEGGCGHDGAFDLVTTYGDAGELWESPWSWCPTCGALFENTVNVQFPSDHAKAALLDEWEDCARFLYEAVTSPSEGDQALVELSAAVATYEALTKLRDVPVHDTRGEA